MHLVETLWLNALDLVEQGIVRRTYLSATRLSALQGVVPLVVIGVLAAISRAVLRMARYVAFVAVCGSPFYFLLRTL